MTGVRLAKLPDRTPVKLVITVELEQHRWLVDDAAGYAETYGQTEKVAVVVPAMLFLVSRERSRIQPELARAIGNVARGSN